MPANLTPQYRKAETEYRKAQTPEEEVECLKEMLRLIPKHKGTDHLQADLKKRLKEARAELTAEKKSPKKGHSYRIPRQGAGQVVLIGAPNSGKSRIVAEFTKAQPEVADFPFTTHEPTPGMMPWEDVTVQLIDTPPITASHIEPYLTSMIRAADEALLCLDGSSDDAPDETRLRDERPSGARQRETCAVGDAFTDGQGGNEAQLVGRGVQLRRDLPHAADLQSLEHYPGVPREAIGLVRMHVHVVASLEHAAGQHQSSGDDPEGHQNEQPDPEIRASRTLSLVQVSICRRPRPMR